MLGNGVPNSESGLESYADRLAVSYQALQVYRIQEEDFCHVGPVE